MHKIDQLIRTKLRQPFIRQELVSRPLLQRQILHGMCGPLTLITAPAGFGKTTLVAACAATCGMPVAWLSLDKNDNQPGRFLTYLIAALQATNPEIGCEAAELMAGIQQARQEAVLTSLINDLDSASVEIALVLDDYHLISSPAVHEELAFLLDHQPAGLHLVIATRSDPPLPLARLRARGQMMELRTAELRFNGHEAGQFLNDVMALHLDDRSVAALEARTEGWIAGLQMAALSMKDRKDITSFINGFSGTNRYILDYLLEEVLVRQPPELQQFLLHTSILERLNAPLCDALLVDNSQTLSSADTLNTLERENLFLIALDDDTTRRGVLPTNNRAGWYRYHHLFADLLQARLQQSQPDLVPHLHNRAAAWFEQNGFIAEAIHHLTSAQEIGQAADLVQQYGPVYWLENDPTLVLFAEGMPLETLLARPKLCLYLAWLNICQAHIERAIPLLNKLERHLKDGNPGSEMRWMKTLISCAEGFLMPPGNLPDYSALAEIPADEPILRDAAEVLYEMALARRGDLESAADVSLRYLQMASTKEHTEPVRAVPSPVPFLARVFLIQGRLQAASSLCREYLSRIQELGKRSINSPGSLEIVLGEVLYEWNHMVEAERYIRDGLRANEPWENIMTNGFGFIALTRLLMAKEDFPAAKLAFQSLEARIRISARPREFEEELCSLYARIQLAEGDLEGAVLWAERITQSESFQIHPEYYRLTVAHIRLAQKQYAEVDEILAADSYLGLSMNRIGRQIETHLLLARSAAGRERMPQAYQDIEASLALAEPEGHLRVFLNMGEPVRDLLAAFLRSGCTQHEPYAQKVLKAFPTTRTADHPATQPESLAEPISSRELEVLRLMAMGRTNQEIARELVVAPGTIKAHAARIYGKLNAANRTEAVARARKLGILS